MYFVHVCNYYARAYVLCVKQRDETESQTVRDRHSLTDRLNRGRGDRQTDRQTDRQNEKERMSHASGTPERTHWRIHIQPTHGDKT